MTCDVPVQAALEYCALGWCVFPLAPRSKQPATVHGFKDASNDPDKVREWWSQRPKSGIGIACALSNLIVLDIDPRSGGEETFQALVERLGPLPKTIEGCTGGGGRHLIFQLPDGLARARGNLGPGVDVKLHGYIVVPPSMHPSGKRYTWIHDPQNAALGTLPGVWIEAIEPSQTLRRPESGTRALVGQSSPYGLAALDGECTKVKHAPDGSRNISLNNAAFLIGQLEAGGEIDPSDSTPALMDAARGCGLSESEARRTIDSGRRGGHLFPRKPERRQQPKTPPDDGAPWPSDEIESEGEPEWSRGLVYAIDKKGVRKLVNTPGNLALLIAHSNGWQRTLGYNELLQAPYWVGTPPMLEGFSIPYGKVGDEHACYVRQWMRRYHGIEWTKEATWDAIGAASMLHRFHPVQRYLEGIEWDGVPRVGTWLQRYFPGTELPDMPMGGWWLISAIARAMRPGCQADHMLILEGPQGVGKSTAAAILGGEWFSAELGDVRDKDAAQCLAGVWIMEIAELDAMKRADFTRVKTFLTQRADHFRPSYGRCVVDRPRQCVFMATTNENKYLHDSSGARRFWPVTVSHLDVDGLYQDRDQLWAEAFQLYRDGERWWPSGERECNSLARIAEERFAVDPWETKLAEVMSDTTELWTIEKLLAGPLGVSVEHQDRAAATRVGMLMGRLGYVSRRTRIKGVRTSVYENARQTAIDDGDKN